MERKRELDRSSIAYQEYAEVAGLSGMPGNERGFFEGHDESKVAVSPDEQVGKPVPVIPQE